MAEALKEIEEVEDDSLMSDLAAAWDDAEKDIAEDTPEETPPVAEVPSESPEQPETAPDEPQDAPDEPEATPAEQPVPEAPEEDKAPVGLPPAAREAWKDTPVAVREALAKREKDFANGIKQYAEGAKRAQMMDQSLAPFQQYLAMTGEPPAKTIHTLLQTASSLQMGTPAQRAQTVANLISQFGVDIQTLDSILSSGQPPEQTQQTDNIQQLIDQRFQQEEQRRQAYEQQQVSQKVAAEVNTFAADPQNEFYNDVKMKMAALMDAAAINGEEMSLGEAYKTACAIHPQISQIIASRTSASEVQKKRQAASSVVGSPEGPGGTAEPDSLRSAIEAAWDTAGRV